jgi:hypothetical protein
MEGKHGKHNKAIHRRVQAPDSAVKKVRTKNDRIDERV